MKRKQSIHFRWGGNSAFLFLLMLVTSCSNYYFSSPQPVDAENIYKFPRQFRGVYTVRDQEEDKDTDIVALEISGKGFKLYLDKEMKIINGIYVNPGDTIGFQKGDTTGNLGAWSKHFAADRPFESTQSIKYDSLNHPKDTVRNYLIRSNKIYKITEGSLEPGASFSLKNDTITCDKRAIEIEFGPLAFLRKISANFYVLNVANASSSAAYDLSNFWWEFYVLEKTKDGKLLVRELQDEFKSNPMYHPNYTSRYYFDNQLTKNEMLKLIEGGDTTMEYRPLKKQAK